MKKKPKFVEPETVKFYACENENRCLVGFHFFDGGEKIVPIRIIREQDYRRLLRTAKKAG